MQSSILGIAGIIVTILGIGVTLFAVAWTAHNQGRALEHPDQQTHIGRQLRLWSWGWFGGGIVFVGIALYLFSKL